MFLGDNKKCLCYNDSTVERDVAFFPQRKLQWKNGQKLEEDIGED